MVYLNMDRGNRTERLILIFSPLLEQDPLSKLNHELFPHDVKRRIWKRRGKACDPKSVDTQCNDMSMHDFQWNWVAGWILKHIKECCSDYFKCC